MAAKREDEKEYNIVVIKKTRDALVIQEGNVMKKYVLEREWEVKSENEKKTTKVVQRREKKKKDEAKKIVNEPKKVVDGPKLIAQKNGLQPCKVLVDQMTSQSIEKIVKNGKEMEKNPMMPQKVHEMSSKKLRSPFYHCVHA